ncbi:MAG TPA: MFS transporter [Mycobacteriales bacterium]|jgi:maltose/moltooligosaccharide transporter|nr:MFS transporter [Mycobacteriales bacterium]
MTVTDRSDAAAVTAREDAERKPLMTSRSIVLMNVGFFGIQYSFGLQQTAVNPLFTLIGANPHDLPLLNLAGPVTGLLIQPLIGAMSDRTWSPKYGRRKPYFLIGAIGCSICLFLFPFVAALWMAVLLLWLLDASNNTAMEPYRAFISDRLPASQLAQGFLTQSMFVGAGAVLANVSLYVFQKLIEGGTAAGVPYWVFYAFFLGAVCSIGSVLISVLSTKEIPPTADELVEVRSRPRGLVATVREIADAVRVMPAGMHKIGLVFAFQWYAMFVYWQFVTISIAESVYNVAPDPDRPEYQEAVGWTGLVNGSYNLVTVFAAVVLIGVARRFGAKRVHAACLATAAACLIAFPQIGNKYLLFLPMIGLGIAWASMMGIPYIMVASMVPKERSGVYMGIVNMMIVIPMLVETVTFGWVFENVLDSRGTNAIMFAGVLLGLGGLAMLWVDPPKGSQESEIMPLGSPRRITSVYDQVIVGSDGSPSSLVAVGHAAGLAAAADAKLVVVSAYTPGSEMDALPAGGPGAHKALFGVESARAALAASVRQLNSDRTHHVDQRLVAGDPARALLDTAGSNPANLIVVGNRGLGAVEGQLLGSVPGDVVKHAVCNVLIVQTTGEDGETAATPGRNGQMRGSTRM